MNPKVIETADWNFDAVAAAARQVRQVRRVRAEALPKMKGGLRALDTAVFNRNHTPKHPRRWQLEGLIADVRGRINQL